MSLSCLFFVGIVFFVLQTPFGGFASQQPTQESPENSGRPVQGKAVFDDYGFNNPIYNTCYPLLDMIAQTLHENPSALCLIEGYRDRDEKRWVSKRRAENAKRYLVECKGIAPKRVLTQDRGFEKLPEGLPGIPRSTHQGKISKNGGIVISVYLPLDGREKKLAMLPVVFDGYLKKSPRYDSCCPRKRRADQSVPKKQQPDRQEGLSAAGLNSGVTIRHPPEERGQVQCFQ
jgi:OmpA family